MIQHLISIIALYAVSISCRKETNNSNLELLTQKTWVLSSYGWDLNKNGLVDPSEENIQACESDNSFDFETNGTGFFSDNELSCSTGIPSHEFKWTFAENGSVLDFVYAKARIIKLDEQQLIIHNYIPVSEDEVKLISVFKH